MCHYGGGAGVIDLDRYRKIGSPELIGGASVIPNRGLGHREVWHWLPVEPNSRKDPRAG